MEQWDATTAKRNFSQIVSASMEEPQIVERHGKPVSVVISYEEFLKINELRERNSISGWLSELADINTREGDMGDIVRIDRRQPEWER